VKGERLSENEVYGALQKRPKDGAKFGPSPSAGYHLDRFFLFRIDLFLKKPESAGFSNTEFNRHNDACRKTKRRTQMRANTEVCSGANVFYKPTNCSKSDNSYPKSGTFTIPKRHNCLINKRPNSWHASWRIEPIVMVIRKRFRQPRTPYVDDMIPNKMPKRCLVTMELFNLATLSMM
jgi:hypothetical protein